MLLANGRPTIRSNVESCWRTIYLVRLFARGKLFSGFFVSHVKLGRVSLSLSQTKLCAVWVSAVQSYQTLTPIQQGDLLINNYRSK